MRTKSALATKKKLEEPEFFEPVPDLEATALRDHSIHAGPYLKKEKRHEHVVHIKKGDDVSKQPKWVIDTLRAEKVI